jgi:hypothetical protein
VSALTFTSASSEAVAELASKCVEMRRNASSLYLVSRYALEGARKEIRHESMRVQIGDGSGIGIVRGFVSGLGIALCARRFGVHVRFVPFVLGLVRGLASLNEFAFSIDASEGKLTYNLPLPASPRALPL